MFVTDVDTRWNSTFCMMDRVLSQRRVITLFTDQNMNIELTSTQWHLIDKVVNSLHSRDQLTREVRSIYIPGYVLINRQCLTGEELKIMRETLLNNLHKLFDYFTSSNNYLSVTYPESWNY